jgi:hypothetical protein
MSKLKELLKMFYVYFVLDYEMDEIYEENDRLKEWSNAILMLYIKEHQEKHKDYKISLVIAMNLDRKTKQYEIPIRS